ncbi:hypothetical protein BH11ARM1_BH11ARM1_01160 [soil metagenome]
MSGNYPRELQVVWAEHAQPVQSASKHRALAQTVLPNAVPKVQGMTGTHQNSQVPLKREFLSIIRTGTHPRESIFAA